MSTDPRMTSELELRMLEGFPVDVLQRVFQRGATAPAISDLRRIERRLWHSRARAETSADHAVWIERIHREEKRNAAAVHCTDMVDSATFFAEFYLQNRPLFMRTFRETGSPPFKWTFADIDRAFPEATVSVHRGRSLKPYFAQHSGRSHRTERLRSFLDEIVRLESSDCYVTANSGAIRGELGRILDDVRPPSSVMRRPEAGEASLWLGPAGAYSPLHYDDANVVIVQLIGSKRVYMIPPHDYALVYASADGPYSEFDPHEPDYHTFPLARFATLLTVDLAPSNALFVPVGWWHAVKSTSPSLSVSYGSFVAPNVYPWLSPV